MSQTHRPGRSCHDAIEAIFDALKIKTACILDADISGCFDNIDHNALLKKLNTTPTFRKTIRGWLRAGVMEDGKFQCTKFGTIQGGNDLTVTCLCCITWIGTAYTKSINKRTLSTHEKKIW